MIKKEFGSKVKKILVLAGMMSVLCSSAVFAAVVEAGGGIWDYGFTGLFNNWVHSKYYHPTEIHGSSVLGCVFDSDYNVAAGAESNANTAAAVYGNKAYYCIGYRSATSTQSYSTRTINSNALGQINNNLYEMHGVDIVRE